MNICYSSLEVCFSFSWCPFFRHPPFWRLSCCPLFWRVKSSFLFTVILPPSFYGGLGLVLFLFFLVFFCFGSFLNPPSYAYYDFFFLFLGGSGVFLEGVQKYFVKIEMMWSNFKKTRATRDARTPPSLLGGRYKKNHKKLPKNGKITFFGPQNHPLKVSSATWTGIFRQPPSEWFRSEILLTLIFVLKRGHFTDYFL